MKRLMWYVLALLTLVLAGCGQGSTVAVDQPTALPSVTPMPPATAQPSTLPPTAVVAQPSPALPSTATTAPTIVADTVPAAGVPILAMADTVW